MSVRVETTNGPVLGRREEGLSVFRGIPYAAPPTGERRWLPPQPPEPWSEPRDASAFGTICPQIVAPGSVFAGTHVNPQDEDCLFLNVWSPALEGSRPVMVWIHGGAFRSGSGSSPLYQGESLARRDVVIVTLNYRLGPLGFLRLAEVTGGRIPSTGSEGLLDQVAALEWVRDNIAAFGGDPGNVTIFGESAGAMSVGALLAMPAVAGLFHKAIVQSGGAHTALPAGKADRVAQRLLAVLGIDPGDEAALRALTPQQLLEAVNAAAAGTEAVPPDPELAGMPMQPTVDSAVLPTVPIEAIKGGAASGIPIIAGTTLDESTLFTGMAPGTASLTDDDLPRRYRRSLGEDVAARLFDGYRQARAARGLAVTPPALLAALDTDRLFRQPTIRLLEAQADQGTAGYHYIFTWPSPIMNGALGSCHAMELGFVWGTHQTPSMNGFFGAGPETDQIMNAMQEAWVNFAHTGAPGSAWSTYESAERTTMIFGADTHIERAPFDDERAIWDDVADSALGAL